MANGTIPSPPSALWLPPERTPARRPDPEVSDAHRTNTRLWEAQVLANMQQEGPVLDDWNRELRAVDPLLRLMKANVLSVCPGVLPGFYHLVRLPDRSTNDIMMVAPLRDPHGNFVEPSFALLDALRACDLQNERAVMERREAIKQAQAAAERDAEREHEDRVNEGMELVRHYEDTTVSMTQDVAWSATNRGRRARRRKR